MQITSEHGQMGQEHFPDSMHSQCFGPGISKVCSTDNRGGQSYSSQEGFRDPIRLVTLLLEHPLTGHNTHQCIKGSEKSCREEIQINLTQCFLFPYWTTCFFTEHLSSSRDTLGCASQVLRSFSFVFFFPLSY